MPNCPAGHASTTTDYCDVCGAPIARNESGAASPGSGSASDPATALPPPTTLACPGCGEPVDGRFCETCGYDVETGRAAPSATLILTLGADRAHWERMVGSGEPSFPTEPPSLTLEVSGDRAALGRVRPGGPDDVELALTGATADPAVSHHQCEFVRAAASWTVRDTDSANGTWINDSTAPLASGEAHRLAEGDRILIGAWTCLTVHFAATA
jgi:hypothetical protein